MNLHCTVLVSVLLVPTQAPAMLDSTEVIVVNLPKGGKPVPGATVKIWTYDLDDERHLLFEGKTGPDGRLTTEELSLARHPGLKNCEFEAMIELPNSPERLKCTPASCKWHVPGEYPRRRTLVLPLEDVELKLLQAGLLGRGGVYRYDLARNQYIKQDESAVQLTSLTVRVCPLVYDPFGMTLCEPLCGDPCCFDSPDFSVAP